MPDTTHTSLDYPPTRKKGKPIRDSIRSLAAGWLATDDRDVALQRFFEPFARLGCTNSAMLLPNAVATAICSLDGHDLRVLTEVQFEVPSPSPTWSPVRKRLDLVIIPRDSDPPKRAVAIEIKATMEFNPMAAALVEFVLLTKSQMVQFIPRRQAGIGPWSTSSAGIKCLTLSCYDHEDIRPVLQMMNRELWPDGRTVEHHNLFFTRESRKAVEEMSTHGSVAESVRLLMRDIRDWCCPAAT